MRIAREFGARRAQDTMTSASTPTPAPLRPLHRRCQRRRRIGRQYLPTDDPFTGKAWAQVARGNAADVERRGERRAPRLQRRRVAGADAVRARPAAVAPGRPGHRQRRRGWRRSSSATTASWRPRSSRRCATWPTTSATTPGWPTRCRARSSRPTRRASSPTRKYEAKGVVAIITPWNSPLTLTSWKLAPALAAGCTAVVKPSEFTSASMLEFARLFDEAGFPQGRRQRRHRARAPRSAQPLVDAPARRAHRLHRRLGGRPQDLRAGGAQLQDRDARARRQVAEHRLRRRRPRPGRQGRRLGHLRRLGPELPGRLAPAGAALDPRPPSSTSCWPSCSDVKLGDPTRAGHADRPDRDAAAVREDPVVHRDRQGRRRRLRARRPQPRPTSAPASSSSRRSSPACATTCASRRRRSSARCWR